MSQLLLKNAQIVTHQEIFSADLLIEQGKISKIFKNSEKPNEVETAELSQKSDVKVIDLQGKHVLPGLIDVHVHFRTPGLTEKEDWISGSKAALAGGVTTVLDMPNTVPPTINAEALAQKREIVQKTASVNYGFYAGATADNVDEITNLKDIVGIKVYMGSSTGGLLVQDLTVLEQLFQKSRKILALHAEKESCIQQGYQHFSGSLEPEGAKVHSKIRAPKCAAQAVQEALDLLKEMDSANSAKANSQKIPPVHFCHVSTGKELALIAEGKKNGLNISAEVTPHHLFLTEEDYEQYGNLVKVNPPLRSREDQEALWKGIEDGVVDMIATDHAPHLLEEKHQPYDKAPSGVPGVQTMLPLLLHAVNQGKLSLSKVVELTSYNPAQRFGLKDKGKIEEGADADLAIIDVNKTEKVCHDFLWSKCGWSPFHKWILQGWPVMTLVAGEVMYEWRDGFGQRKGKEV